MRNSLFVTLAVLLLHPNVSFAASKLDDQISALVQRSQASATACEEFRVNVAKLVRSEVNGPTATLKDPKQAGSLLKLIKTYPGVPDGTAEAAKLVLDASFKGETFDTANFMKIRDCYPMSLYDADRALLEANKSPEAKDQVIHDLKTNFGPSLMDQLVRVRLLQKLEDSHLVHLRNKKAELASVQKQADELKDKIQKRLHDKKTDYRNNLIFEIKSAASLQKKVDQLVKAI